MRGACARSHDQGEQENGRGQARRGKAERFDDDADVRWNGRFAVSEVAAHANSGRGGAVAAGDFIELASEFGQPLGGGAKEIGGDAAGLRQHFRFEQIADAAGFLFQGADNFFKIFHVLLTRTREIFRYYRDGGD